MKITPQVQRWLRFVAGGGINTGFSYLLYLLLGLVLNYQFAFFVAYIAGIFFSYWFNARFVFHVPLSWKGLLSYPLVYVVQYVISALLLGSAVEWLGIDKRIAPLAITSITLPITYLMSKFLLASRKPASPDHLQ
ncbi:GtrA family protein [Comamonas koreensis]|uniref:GtrA family protein n=1 Tax=Comamonas koreensis TaxID=160825 RepID=UPI001E3B5DEE|nr:GtrA family protein [Comamonas koreensis]